MALSEFELKKIEKVMHEYLAVHRPSVHIRPQLDICYRISNQSVEIFEVRPHWKEPDVAMENPVAKATYVKSQKIWKIYWQRSDLNWHRYDPHPEAKTLEEFTAIVAEDKHFCFYG